MVEASGQQPGPLTVAQTDRMRSGLLYISMADPGLLVSGSVFEDLQLCLDEIDRLRAGRP